MERKLKRLASTGPAWCQKMCRRGDHHFASAKEVNISTFAEEVLAASAEEALLTSAEEVN